MKYTSLSFLFLLLIASSCGDKQKRISIAAPKVEKAIFYQINVRDFTPEGTFKAMLPRLAEIKALGVNTLVLAPIHSIGQKNRQGTLGSLKASSDFNAIHADLGTTADFTALLDSCHAQGLYVLMEWNNTTTSADHPWLTTHPDWFKIDSSYYPTNVLADLSLLNTAVDSVQAELAKSLAYWVESFGIDGYYVKSADVLAETWWTNTLSELKKIKPLLFLAHTENQKLQEAGFDLMVDAGVYNQLAALFVKPNTAHQAAITALDNHLHYICQPWTGSAAEMPVQRYSNRKAAMLACLLNVILPGNPFLVAGEEVGHTSPLLPYEKNNIIWSANPDIRSLYSTLLHLRTTASSLSEAGMGSDSLSHPEILLLRRGQGLNTIYTLINPTDSLANVEIPTQMQGKRFTDLFTGRSVLLEKELLMLEFSFYLLKEDATS